MRRLLLAALVASISPAAHAQFLHSGGQHTGPRCPNQATASSDGCSGANFASTTQDSAFFTEIRQSGQGAYAALPPWNVAGVAYPVGYYTPTASLLDPQVSVPANCSLVANDSQFVATQPAIVCPTTAGTNVDIEGYDFGPIGTHDCTPVRLDTTKLTAGTTVKIWDNLFENGTECSNSIATSGTGMIQTSVPTTSSPYASAVAASIDVEFNTWKGHAGDACCNAPPVTRIPRAMGFLTTGGNITFQYNAVEDWPGDPIYVAVASPYTVNIRYNYIRGWEFRSPQAHGEMGSITYPDTGDENNIGGALVGYNTVATDSQTASNGTALIWLANGSSATTYVGAMTADHNVVVANNTSGATAATTVSFTLSDVTETTSGNVATFTSGTPYVGMGISGTGLNLYQYLGNDGSGHPQYTVDCAGVGTIICTGAAYASALSFTMASYTGKSTSIITANADIVSAGHTLDQTQTLTNNYLDMTGTSSGSGNFWAQGTKCNGTPGSSISGNVNMLTGAAVNAYALNTGTGC